MEFSLTPQQQAQVDAARTYARELAVDYQIRKRTGLIEKDVFLEMGRRGFIGAEISPDLGGRGESRLTSGLLLEQIATGDFNVGYLQVVGSLVGQILASNARPEVAKEWVPQITGGTGVVGIGLSEPTGGSDAGNPQMRAERDGSGDGADWLITGAKSMSLMEYCTGAVVFARTADGAAAGASPPSSSTSPGPASPASRTRTWAPSPSGAARSTSTGSGCRRATCSARSARASPRSCRASTSAGP